MAQQLIYTSSSRLLVAGRTGFGTVARPRELSGILVTALERASQFDRSVGFDSHRVMFSFRQIQAGSRRFAVVSRTRDAGSDYTGRTNHIAHHLIITPEEQEALAAAGVTPASISLSAPWRSSWDEDPRYLDAADDIDLSGCGTARSGGWWEFIAGDPAFAHCLLDPKFRRGAFVLYPSSLIQDDDQIGMVSLIAESSSLDPGKAWDFPFTSQLQPSDDSSDFALRCVPENSPLAKSAREPGRLLLDLTAPESLPAPPPRPTETPHQPAAIQPGALEEGISDREAADGADQELQRIKSLRTGLSASEMRPRVPVASRRPTTQRTGRSAPGRRPPAMPSRRKRAWIFGSCIGLASLVLLALVLHYNKVPEFIQLKKEYQKEIIKLSNDILNEESKNNISKNIQAWSTPNMMRARLPDIKVAVNLIQSLIELEAEIKKNNFTEINKKIRKVDNIYIGLPLEFQGQIQSLQKENSNWRQELETLNFLNEYKFGSNWPDSDISFQLLTPDTIWSSITEEQLKIKSRELEELKRPDVARSRNFDRVVTQEVSSLTNSIIKVLNAFQNFSARKYYKEIEQNKNYFDQYITQLLPSADQQDDSESDHSETDSQESEEGQADDRQTQQTVKPTPTPTTAQTTEPKPFTLEWIAKFKKIEFKVFSGWKEAEFQITSSTEIAFDEVFMQLWAWESNPNPRPLYYNNDDIFDESTQMREPEKKLLIARPGKPHYLNSVLIKTIIGTQKFFGLTYAIPESVLIIALVDNRALLDMGHVFIEIDPEMQLTEIARQIIEENGDITEENGDITEENGDNPEGNGDITFQIKSNNNKFNLESELLTFIEDQRPEPSSADEQKPADWIGVFKQTPTDVGISLDGGETFDEQLRNFMESFNEKINEIKDMTEYRNHNNFSKNKITDLLVKYSELQSSDNPKLAFFDYIENLLKDQPVIDRLIKEVQRKEIPNKPEDHNNLISSLESLQILYEGEIGLYLTEDNFQKFQDTLAEAKLAEARSAPAASSDNNSSPEIDLTLQLIAVQPDKTEIVIAEQTITLEALPPEPK